MLALAFGPSTVIAPPPPVPAPLSNSLSTAERATPPGSLLTWIPLPAPPRSKRSGFLPTLRPHRRATTRSRLSAAWFGPLDSKRIPSPPDSPEVRASSAPLPPSTRSDLTVPPFGNSSAVAPVPVVPAGPRITVRAGMPSRVPLPAPTKVSTLSVRTDSTRRPRPDLDRVAGRSPGRLRRRSSRRAIPSCVQSRRIDAAFGDEAGFGGGGGRRR